MLNNIRDRFQNFRNRKSHPVEIQQLQTELLEESQLSSSYLALTVSSCVIATLGLLSNSAAVIIGAMIIAPLMLPIRGMALGALQGHIILFRKGAIALGIGTFLSVVISYCLGLIVSLLSFGSEILSRSRPTLLDLGIAVAAGAISGYAKAEPKVSGSLAGTAISVALMPPICVIGLGLSRADWWMSLGATILYLTNLLGITLACMLTFLVVGYISLTQAKKPLLWTIFLTIILLLPLGFSFFRLLRQTQLETSLQRALIDRTVTFQRLELLSKQTNWFTDPPQVRLNVRAKEPVTPRQVQLLEEFLYREMGQRFILIFEVGEVEEVRSSQSQL
ncbi:TIGR00341 family protein [cyanobacterium TDX16]|nr:TIGR00341 family protein [cyanobacterium TDX16]